MKLKIDRFKDFQMKLYNINQHYTDNSKLPNPFLRVLKLLEESDRPRTTGFPFINIDSGEMTFGTATDLTINTNTTANTWPLTFTTDNPVTINT